MCPAESKLDQCKAVILVGDRDFGRCLLASGFNRALWPVFGKPALQILLEHLEQQGIRRVVIACASQSDIIWQSISCPPALTVTFQEKTLPRGPAGCIRDAAEPEDEHLLVLSGNMLVLPDIRALLQKHLETHADMTVFLNPPKDGQSPDPVDSQIYLCEPTTLSCIPESGYFDLKEGFVPASIQYGLTICAATLSDDPRHFRNWTDYLLHLNSLLLHHHKIDGLLGDYSRLNGHSDIWIGRDVNIAQSAKIYGPVVIGSHSAIADGVMIFGPAVIGDNTHIAPGCLIEESILWDDVTAGPGTRIKRSLISSHCSIPQGRQIASGVLISPGTRCRQIVSRYRRSKIRRQIKKTTGRPQPTTVPATLQQMVKTPAQKLIGAIAVFFVLLAMVISFWNPTLRTLVKIWLESDEYSSGLLVPFIAVYVLWQRRTSLSQTLINPCFGALGLLILAQGIRFFGLYFMYASAERFSFVLSIGAVVLFLMGWGFFKKFLPVFLFLFLMLPLPHRVEGYLTVPLQAWATVSSVFCLETLGFSVIREGNVININGTLVAVAEACNGLRMLTAFIVVSGLVALSVNRSRPEKLVILLSSIPIALACNTLRLIITSIAFTKLDTQRWEKAFHDFGGFAMMPVAILIILFELWLLSRLFIEPKKKQQQVIYRKESGNNEND